ncbi:MAG: bifunctional helix-turn-helix transcriptional regulator/GNAT family N-acetyltransferase [Candidatus Aminicenantes bacterium]|nr:bifunctional helix-turn-helix transcriptional regulator/GNAT family N-acetyltransferase [Candidatus Aminicenantes bacterium]
MDFIQKTGYLAVASRLKRLTDRLLSGGSEVYKALRLEFEPRWFSLFYLLQSKDGPVSILEAADALRVSHPAVIQTAKILMRQGLIASRQDKVDRRKRLLSLTPRGRRLAEDLLPVWECFAQAAKEFFRDAGVDMLDVLRRVEKKLDEEDLSLRILKKIKNRQYEAVEIIDFRPEHKDRFRKLNEAWLKKHFKVEPADRKMLGDPEGEILSKGGFIFFAIIRGEVVGTAALLKLGEETYELAKMAVAEPAQGKQAGRKLLDAAIARARGKKARTIVLKTDKCLRVALNLYRRGGFRVSRTPGVASEHFKREKTATYMRLDLA